MTIQIELSQEMEEALESRARLQGLPAAHYAQQILKDALAVLPAERPRATVEEFRAFLDAMAISSKGTKLTAGETFDREFIYGDHA
jgi:hypothetical protein